ncbi:hypothetical protein LLE49_08460 [Alicyclobacillus tolerans]|uniref:TIGR02530 family flagellar biosynthesis protein n=1 Tax=Alicyclobacillus tolerans TaxID=90970 RepID=UPI001F3D486B|nr:TIGR02530 family flagellar biosynthesis protein [Alicyclobacillus tolerans]MCF8564759.1 hypothetical protein [Alicyclobacillus tolerans]
MDEQLLQRIATPAYTAVPKTQKGSAQPAGTPFSKVLEQAQTQDGQQKLRLSAHAQTRLRQRNVALSPQDMTRLSQAVDTASKKGAKDAYVMYGNTGFVINVPNRTVITAMTNEEQTVVTNIDSVVVVPKLDQYGGFAAGTD